MTFKFIRHFYYSRLISVCLIITFIATMVITPKASYAGVIGLPAPGTMVNLSPAYVPLMITGLTIHPENPLLMDFIVSTGNSGLNADQVKKESDRLIKYFLACLTIPENNQWVNLSPYEKQRIIPQDLGQTVLGQDMLAQDYLLKQLTASLIYPEKNLGKNFWDKVYAKARQIYGTTQIPVNTFNKVWILPETAKVYEHKDTVFVVKSHLKVMLDEDYLALSKHQSQKNTVILSPSLRSRAGSAKDLNRINSLRDSSASPQNDVNTLGSQIIRQIILPAIEQEVNHGQNFAQLRQIYNSMILAVWFKKNLKQALLNQVYTNKSKIIGVNVDDPAIKEKIYEQYLQAYKKGVFNYIKEEPADLSLRGGYADEAISNGTTIARKYFSGGLATVREVAIGNEDDAMAAFEGEPEGDKEFREPVTVSEEPKILDDVRGSLGQQLYREKVYSMVGMSASGDPEATILLPYAEFVGHDDARKAYWNYIWGYVEGLTAVLEKEIPGYEVTMEQTGTVRGEKIVITFTSTEKSNNPDLYGGWNEAMTALPKKAISGKTSTGAYVENYKNAEEVGLRAAIEMADTLYYNNSTDKDTIFIVSMDEKSQLNILNDFIGIIKKKKGKLRADRLKIVVYDNLHSASSRHLLEYLKEYGLKKENIFIERLSTPREDLKAFVGNPNDVDLVVGGIESVTLDAFRARQVMVTATGDSLASDVENVLEGRNTMSIAAHIRDKVGVSFLIDNQAGKQLTANGSFGEEDFDILIGRAVMGRMFTSTIPALDARKFGQKAFLRQAGVLFTGQGKEFDPVKIGRQMREKLADAKVKGIPLTLKLHYRLIDPFGSSQDLPGWQTSLTPKGVEVFFNLPSTVVMPSDLSAEFTVTPSANPDAIEYASSYSKYLVTRNRTQPFDLDKFDRDKPAQKGEEHEKLKYTDLLAYTARNFGLDSGFRVTLGHISGVIKSGGFESSNIFAMGLIAICSTLSGADLDWGNIFSMAVRLENNEAGNHTGGQGHKNVPNSDLPAMNLIWPSGIVDAMGEYANGYSSVVVDMFDGRNGRLNHEQGKKFIHDHFRVGNAGKMYRNGSAVVGRLAALTNDIWTRYKDNDPTYKQLIYKMIRYDKERKKAFSRGNAQGAVESMNKLSDIRDEGVRRYMNHLIDALQGKVVPAYANGLVEEVMERSYKETRDHEDNPKFDERADAFYFIRQLIMEKLRIPEDDERYFNWDAIQGVIAGSAALRESLNTLRDIKLYSYDPIYRLVAEGRKRGIAVFGMGAGGMGAGLGFASADVKDSRGSVIKTALQNIEELLAAFDIGPMDEEKADRLTSGKEDGLLKGYVPADTSTESPQWGPGWKEVGFNLPEVPPVRKILATEIGMPDSMKELAFNAAMMVKKPGADIVESGRIDIAESRGIAVWMAIAAAGILGFSLSKKVDNINTEFSLAVNPPVSRTTASLLDAISRGDIRLEPPVTTLLVGPKDADINKFAQERALNAEVLRRINGIPANQKNFNPPLPAPINVVGLVNPSIYFTTADGQDIPAPRLKEILYGKNSPRKASATQIGNHTFEASAYYSSIKEEEEALKRLKADGFKITHENIQTVHGLKEVEVYTFSPAGDKAALVEPGGIDLNSRNLKIDAEGQKVDITFNPAMIAQFRRGDFSGVRIKILDVVRVNLLPLLGLKVGQATAQLALR